METNQKEKERASEDDVNANPLLQHDADDATVTVSSHSTVQNVDYTCGIGSWRPKGLQLFTNFNAAFCVVLFAMTCTTLNFAAFSTATASWERRYGFSTTFIGLTFTFLDVASIIALPILTYFGGQPDSHRPRWMASGMLCATVGLFIIGSVQFMTGPYDIGTSLFEAVNASMFPIGLCSSDKYGVLAVGDLNHSSGTMPDSDCANQFIRQENVLVVVMIFIGLFLIGGGISAIFSLAITYIDDNVPRVKSPLYMGTLYAMFGLGPLIGFPMASYFTSLYVDFYRVNTAEIEISQYDPRWVGAWWLPFLLNASILCIASMALILLPKKFRVQSDDGSETPRDKADEFGKMTMSQKLKGFPVVVRRLIRNAPFMFISIGHCCDVALVAALVPFLTKYVRDQFRTSISVAAIATPVCFVLPATIGTVLGGLLLRKFKPKLPTIAKIMTIVSICVVVSIVPMMFIGCDNYDVAGVNVPYSGQRAEGGNFTDNFDAPCNIDCQCSAARFNPVCGSNGITYFSPCHAGCKGIASRGETGGFPMSRNLTDCSCLAKSTELNMYIVTPVVFQPSPADPGESSTVSGKDSMANSADAVAPTHMTLNGERISSKRASNDLEPVTGERYDYITVANDGEYAETGICGTQCTQQMILYIIAFFCLSLIKALTTTCDTELTLRCVDPIDKSIALGLRGVFTEIIAWIPTPIYIGAVFDSTCQVWGKTPCGERGACWVYDLPAYRMKYVAVIISIKVVATLFYTLNWCSIRGRTGDETRDNQYNMVGSTKEIEKA
ncbi:solute carrier organic anion transporter family member 2A1-like [Glandiceps talaboti]